MRRRAILLLVVMAAALVFSSTVALAVTRQCKTDRDCFGTKERDKLLGTDGSNFIYAKGGDDRLFGYGEYDELYGQGGNDKLFGGDGVDWLEGGPGDDASDGGEGIDTYVFVGNNWGDDTLKDPDTGNWISFIGDTSTNLTIELASVAGLPEVTNEASTSTVNWNGNVISHVLNGSSGDDTIGGNDAANTIRSDYGNDSDEVYGGGGNDLISVFDNDDGDYVDCGEDAGDNDTVTYDTGDTVVDCETLNEN